MKAKKTLTFDIASSHYITGNMVERGAPSAKIIVEFPPIIEDLQAFRDALEAAFAEILEACK